MKLKKKIYEFLTRFYCPFLPSKGKGLLKRGSIYAKLLKHSGKNLKISSGVNFFSPENVKVGKDVFIGFSSYLGAGEITLEDEVVIGPFCSITAGNHLFKNGSVIGGGYEFGKIVIGKGSWLCAHVCVTSGVTIGKGCLISAGSVVTKDVPDFTVVGGVPAKYIKNNKAENEKR